MSEDVESLLKAWTAAFSEEVLDYAQPPEVRDEEVSVFSYLYISNHGTYTVPVIDSA